MVIAPSPAHAPSIHTWPRSTPLAAPEAKARGTRPPRLRARPPVTIATHMSADETMNHHEMAPGFVRGTHIYSDTFFAKARLLAGV